MYCSIVVMPSLSAETIVKSARACWLLNECGATSLHYFQLYRVAARSVHCLTIFSDMALQLNVRRLVADESWNDNKAEKISIVIRQLQGQHIFPNGVVENPWVGCARSKSALCTPRRDNDKAILCLNALSSWQQMWMQSQQHSCVYLGYSGPNDSSNVTGEQLHLDGRDYMIDPAWNFSIICQSLREVLKSWRSLFTKMQSPQESGDHPKFFPDQRGFRFYATNTRAATPSSWYVYRRFEIAPIGFYTDDEAQLLQDFHAGSKQFVIWDSALSGCANESLRDICGNRTVDETTQEYCRHVMSVCAAPSTPNAAMFVSSPQRHPKTHVSAERREDASQAQRSPNPFAFELPPYQCGTMSPSCASRGQTVQAPVTPPAGHGAKRTADSPEIQLAQREADRNNVDAKRSRFTLAVSEVSTELRDESTTALLSWVRSAKQADAFKFGGMSNDGWPSLKTKDGTLPIHLCNALRFLVEKESWGITNFMKFRGMRENQTSDEEAWDYVIWGVVAPHLATAENLTIEQDEQLQTYRASKLEKSAETEINTECFKLHHAVKEHAGKASAEQVLKENKSLHSIVLLVHKKDLTIPLFDKLIKQAYFAKDDEAMQKTLAQLIITSGYLMLDDEYTKNHTVSHYLESWSPKYKKLVHWYLRFFAAVGDEYHFSTGRLQTAGDSDASSLLIAKSKITPSMERVLLAFWRGVNPLGDLLLRTQECAIHKMMNVVSFLKQFDAILNKPRVQLIVKELKVLLEEYDIAVNSQLVCYLNDTPNLPCMGEVPANCSQQANISEAAGSDVKLTTAVDTKQLILAMGDVWVNLLTDSNKFDEAMMVFDFQEKEPTWPNLQAFLEKHNLPMQ